MSRNIYLLKKSSLFNKKWYLSHYSDVRITGINPYFHYLCFGAKEGRDPSLEFSSVEYLKAYPDVQISHFNPLVHFIKFGEKEGRKPYRSTIYSQSKNLYNTTSLKRNKFLYASHRARLARELASLRKAKPPCPPPVIPENIVLFKKDNLKVSEVTVVVPSYNYAHYINEALESVKHQTLSNLDLIVVDDGSSDSSIAVTLQWIQQESERFNRVLLVENTRNSGLALTRNVGFSHVKSLFVLTLDADNVLLPAFAEKCLAQIKLSGAAYVYPLIQKFGAMHSLMGIQPYDPRLLACMNYIDSMALIRLSAWDFVGGYHHIQHGWEDYDFWCRFAEAGLFGVQVNEVLAKYRAHHKSMLAQNTDRTNTNPWNRIKKASPPNPNPFLH